MNESQIKELIAGIDGDCVSGDKKGYVGKAHFVTNTPDYKGYDGKFRASVRNNAKDKFEAIRSFIGEIDSYSHIEVSDSSGGSWNKDHWERMSGDCAVYDILNKKGEKLITYPSCRTFYRL